ncbi:MAG: hypothetical protein KA352_09445 [Flavobacteriales bacterium]|nr:hypothetical protein [Flavobacteriales bacterium]
MRIALTTFFVACTGFCTAQIGGVDPLFGDTGIVISDIPGFMTFVERMALQADQKVVVLAQSGTAGSSAPRVYRFDEFGAPDPTFGTDGAAWVASDPSTYPDAHDIEVQQDGKLLVMFDIAVSSTEALSLARLNANGDMDTTYGAGGVSVTTLPGAHLRPLGLALQPDDKAVVCGWTNQSQIFLARFLTDGTLDTTFGAGGIAFRTVNGYALLHEVIVQPDGKILACGGGSVDNNTRVVLWRVDASGVPDPTFTTDGFVITHVGPTDAAHDVAWMPDGRIVVCGTAWGNVDQTLVARYNSNGSLDTSFNGDGLFEFTNGGPTHIARGLVVLPDSTIFCVGARSLTTPFAFKLSHDGTLDTSFAPALGSLGFPDLSWNGNGLHDVVLRPNGKITACGRHQNMLMGPDVLLIGFDLNLPTGMMDQEHPALRLFPVPATDEICLDLGAYSSEVVEVTITSADGKVMSRSNGSGDRGLTTRCLDVRTLAAGAYVVCARTARGSARSAFIKN